MATKKAVELAPSLPVLGAVLGAVAFLLVRLVPDVTGKSIFSDEAVAGLVGARPFPEVVKTAVRVIEAVRTASGGRVVLPRYRPPLCVGLRLLGAAC